MGGEPNGEGVVLKSRIEEVIREFELTIDIEEFLGQVHGEELDFESFRHLFESDEEMRSILSKRSVRVPVIE